MLIEALRQKYPQLDVVPMEPIESAQSRKPIGLPKETKTSRARKNLTHSGSTDPPTFASKSKPSWKPAANVNATRHGIIPPTLLSQSSNFDQGLLVGNQKSAPQSFKKPNSVKANRSSFYTDEKSSRGGEPDKGHVFRQYSTIMDQKPRVRKQIKKVIIADMEENLSSKAVSFDYSIFGAKLFETVIRIRLEI